MGNLLFALGGWRRQLRNFELRFPDGRISASGQCTPKIDKRSRHSLMSANEN
jgi:hypothetical protein